MFAQFIIDIMNYKQLFKMALICPNAVFHSTLFSIAVIALHLLILFLISFSCLSSFSIYTLKYLNSSHYLMQPILSSNIKSMVSAQQPM